MEDARVGAVFRAVRIRRRMAQAEVAEAAGVGRAVISRLECGQIEGMTLGTVRRVAAALSISVPLEPRWRGAELASLLDERHAAIVSLVAARLESLGWEVLPEHTFSVWGERGSLDLFAWHARHRAVLVVEVKTRLVDLQDLLATLDRKRRLAPGLARDVGWRPIHIGSVLVMPEGAIARNAIARFGPVLAAAMPARTLEVRRWLRQPSGDLRGIWFLVDAHSGSTKWPSGGTMRVGRRRKAPGALVSRSDRAVGARRIVATEPAAGSKST
jgi:transcriptional regulator with XRE-family HTH domain